MSITPSDKHPTSPPKDKALKNLAERRVAAYQDIAKQVGAAQKKVTDDNLKGTDHALALIDRQNATARQLETAAQLDAIKRAEHGDWSGSTATLVEKAAQEDHQKLTEQAEKHRGSKDLGVLLGDKVALVENALVSKEAQQFAAGADMGPVSQADLTGLRTMLSGKSAAVAAQAFAAIVDLTKKTTTTTEQPEALRQQLVIDKQINVALAPQLREPRNASLAKEMLFRQASDADRLYRFPEREVAFKDRLGALSGLRDSARALGIKVPSNFLGASFGDDFKKVVGAEFFS